MGARDYPDATPHAYCPGVPNHARGFPRSLLTAAVLCWVPAAASGQTPWAASAPPAGPGGFPLSWLHHTSWLLGRDLPIGGVSSLVRTPDGYLWMGSPAGLVRFDGVRFRILDGETVPALASGVPGNTIPLLVDHTGALWVSRADGALVRYGEGRFEVALAPSAARPAIEDAVEDGGGRIWLRGGVRAFAWENADLVDDPLPRELRDARVSRIVADTADGIWVGTVAHGLWHVRDGVARPQAYTTAPETGQVTPLLQTRAGALWIAANGLQVLESERWTGVTFAGSALNGVRAVEAEDGSVWLASRTGLIRRAHYGALEQLTSADGLTADLMWDVLVDDEGSAWLATEAGLDRLRAAPFVTVGPADGLPVETLLHVFGDAGGGVWVMDYTARTSYLLDGGPVRRTGGAVTSTAIPGRDIPVTASSRGGLWRHELHSDVVHLFRDGVQTTVRPSAGLAWAGPRDGVEDQNGVLWIASGGGSLGRVRDFAYEPISLPGVEGAPRVASHALDGRGHVWVSLSDPRVLFALDEGVVVGRFDASDGVRSPLLHLALESGDTLWATTPTRELARVIGGRVTTISIPDLGNALAAGSVVLLPTRDHLWVGSQGGIGRLPLGALHAAADGAAGPPEPEWFGELDGLEMARTTRGNDHSGFRAADGRLWFATPAGLAVADPTALPNNPIPPRPRVDYVRVSGRPGPVADGGDVERGSERLEIHFTAGSLRTPERVRMEYRLDGVDPDWLSAGAERSASYTQLRPGRYSFRVRAWNEDGVPSDGEATYSIRVLPFWFETAAFRGASALMLLALASGAFFVVQRARTRAAEERIRAHFEATLSERARLARELHDTLLQGFTGVTLQLQALKVAIARSSPSAAAALESVLGVADGTLRDARGMISDMRSIELEERGLVEALRSAARAATSGTVVELSFETRGEVRRLAPAVETALFRVGREAATNAVRHAGATRVRLQLAFGGRNVELSVEDDGRGTSAAEIERADASGHWGIVGMRERARQAGGRLDIESHPGVGTRVTLTIPLPDDVPA